MSKRFILTALVVCGTIFALHLALWVSLIVQSEECPTGISMMTLVSAFATAMYWLYYKAKTGNDNNRLRKQ